MSIRIGHILRHEDESGISGTGIVAEWIEYSDGEVVVHWLSHTPSTNHYRNFKQVDAIHGHGGRTELVTIWEQPKPGAEPEEEPETSLEDLEEEDVEEPTGEKKTPRRKKTPARKKASNGKAKR